MQLYVCGYYQDRAACTSSLRRPVSDIDTKCIDWIKANILREWVVLDILAEVRKRVVDHTKDSVSEVAQLEKQSAELQREITNLAEAIAVTKGTVSALTEKLTERQERLSTIDARLELLKAAPDVFSLEVRRIEAGVRKRNDHLHELLGATSRGPTR